jgi:hypothetical protein
MKAKWEGGRAEFCSGRNHLVGRDWQIAENDATVQKATNRLNGENNGFS